MSVVWVIDVRLILPKKHKLYYKDQHYLVFVDSIRAFKIRPVLNT